MAIGRVASQVTWYSMVLVLAALLPPKDFGTVAAGLGIVGVATLLMQSGTGGSIIAARMLGWTDVRRALIRNLAAGVVLTGLIVATGGPIARAISEGGDPDVLRVLGVSVTVTALSVVPLALLRKAMHFKRLAAVNTGAAVLTSVIAIVAAVLGAGVWALVLRQLLLQALVASFAWLAVRDVVGDLRSTSSDGTAVRRTERLSFLVVSVSSFLALSLDNVAVGAATNATQLGFYALAFALAFAPLTQFSWQLGGVLFPAAAATSSLETVGRRAVQVVRVMGLILFPVVPAAIALAPIVLPALLGPEWRPMVVPFQVLLVVGVSHAVYNTIADSLSGTGNIGFRARCESAWAVATILGVIAGTQAFGIRGAAIAHLIVFVPLGLAYILVGTRRIGTDARRLWEGLRDVVAAVAVESAVIAAVIAALDAAAVNDAVAATIAVLVGLLAALAVLWRAPSRPLTDARAVAERLLSRTRRSGRRQHAKAAVAGGHRDG